MIQYLQKHSSFYLLLAFIFIFSACEIINPEESIPSYIRINQIGLETAYGQGTASQKIVDVWIYVDDELIGAFELPATFPVIAEGYHEIIIKPGIELNGIAPTRAIYPFYSPIIKNINFIKDSIIVLDSLFALTTFYYNDTEFPWGGVGQEDFEESGITIDSTYRSETGITVTSQDVFEGNHSGLVTLSGTVDFFEAKSDEDDPFYLPQAGSYVFLELNYKTNNHFTVGVFANSNTSSSQHPIFVIKPNDEWNKIYINLTPTVSRETQALDFNIFFGAVLDEGVEKAEILFDNIKLVHF